MHHLRLHQLWPVIDLAILTVAIWFALGPARIWSVPGQFPLADLACGISLAGVSTILHLLLRTRKRLTGTEWRWARHGLIILGCYAYYGFGTKGRIVVPTVVIWMLATYGLIAALFNLGLFLFARSEWRQLRPRTLREWIALAVIGYLFPAFWLIGQWL